MFDSDTVEAARTRDGEAAQDRDAEVSDSLEWPTVGKGRGEPLAADSYSNYPSDTSALSGPKWRRTILELLSHPAIKDWDDATAELFGKGDSHVKRKRRRALERACGGFGIEASELFAKGNPNDLGGPADARATLTADLSKHVARESNPLCIAHLYLEKGLSCEEIDTIFESPDGTARERLYGLGLVRRRKDRDGGKSMSDLLVNPPEEDGEDGEDADGGGGITVDTRDF